MKTKPIGMWELAKRAADRVEKELQSGRVDPVAAYFIAKQHGIDFDDKFDNTDPGDEKR